MVAFIKQEALEKAREIQIKAEEEFAIEKSRLVRAETAAIDAQYERKFKQASLSQQISQSTVTNKTRLKVLAARQQLLDDIFEQARGRLGDISRDEGAYEAILVNLVLEGLYALNESTLEVLCREKDIAVTGRAVKTAQDMFKERTGGDCAVTISEDDTLADESYGFFPPPESITLLLTASSVTAAFGSLAGTARSRSTTRSSSASGSSSPKPCPLSVPAFSALTRTASSTIKKDRAVANDVIHLFFSFSFAFSFFLY